MKPFNIHCTTCHQRLRVRDESAIGEILICPKCGSMVLVEPPPETLPTVVAEPALPETPPVAAAPPMEEWVEPPPVGDESAGAEEGIEPPPVGDESDSVEEEVEPPPEVEPPIIAPPIAAYSGTAPDDLPEPPAADQDYGPDAPPSEEERPLDEEPQPPPIVAAAPAAMSVLAEPLVLPPPADVAPPEEAAPAVQRLRQGLKIAGAVAVGSTLAVALFALLASWSSAPPPDRPATAGPAPPAPVAPPDTTVVPPVPDAKVTPTEPPGGGPAAPPTVASPNGPPPAQSAEKTPSTPSDTKAAPKLEPPGDASAKAGPLEPAAKTDAGADATALDETLKALSPFTDPPPSAPAGAMPPAAQAKPSAAKPAEDKLPAPPVEPPSEEPAAPRPEPRAIDVAARLQDPLEEIDLPPMPLGDFCRFLTGLSTVPITLDPDALALVKATPQTRVTVKLKNTTTGAVLNAALQPLKLGYTVVGQQIVVSRPPLPEGQLRELPHPVGDLVGNDNEQLEQLAALIVDAVQPQSWEANGGRGTMKTEMPNLIIRQQETILFQTLLFCEKLRTARGLPHQSKFDPALFQLEPRWLRAQRKLAAPVTVNYPQPTPLVRIFEQLTRGTGVDILVDWVAIAELGWTPDGEALLSADKEPLSAVLNKLLQSLDLAYRVVDGTTVQVTTRPVVQLRPEVELYPVGDLLAPPVDARQLLQRIREQFLARDLEGVVPVFCVDPPSKHLIVALPQPQQQAFAQWLAAQRGAKPPPAKP